jgi:hypothetical protein
VKICAKCGKANDVTRKYCTGCGASLLMTTEQPKPKPTIEIPEVGRVVTGASLKSDVSKEPSFPETSSISDDERIVRPSEVSVDRVRTAERHVEKTEYEKAQDAFADSESVAPDERTLRASDFQELEGEVNAEADEQPSSEGMSIEPEVESESIEHKEGKDVVKQILERVKAAEALANSEDNAVPIGTQVVAPEEEISKKINDSIADEKQAAIDELEEVADDIPVSSLPEEISVEKRVPDIPISVSKAVDESVRDEKIRSLDSDIKSLNIERQHLQTEYDAFQVRLDEEVERYRTIAETKRIRAEGIERELRLAKQEFDDANKDHKNVENRRKKELSDAEKRISDVDKRVKKAEEAKEKRIRDLEKERLKREEEAKKV